jgi:hypothetical protein
MEYPLKRGFKPEMDRIKGILEAEFPVPVSQEEGKLRLSYGALKSVVVWLEGRKLAVVTEALPGASDEMALDANRRFRSFLEKATGYTAKQRLEMAKKEVQRGE